MLTTSRGTLVTSRSGVNATRTNLGLTQTLHFRGTDAQSLESGRWRFQLESAPGSVEWVDYDGALLHEGLLPGFEWDGGVNVDLLLAPNAFCAEAMVHIRTTG